MTDYSSMSDEELLALYNKSKLPAVAPKAPIDYSQFSDAQLIAMKNGETVSSPPSYLSDLYEFGKKGVGEGISGAGWLADRATGYGKSVQDYGDEMRKAAEAEISPLATERASRDYVEKAAPGEGMFGYKPNFSALAGAPYQIAESLPGSLAGMGAAAAATALAPEVAIGGVGAAGVAALRVLGPFGEKLAMSALGKAGTAAATATGKNIFEAAAPEVGKAIIATLSGNVAEGLQAAGMDGQQTEEATRAALKKDPSILNATPLGKQALIDTNGDVNKAIDLAAKRAGTQSAITTGLSTAALSLPGSAYEASIITGGAKRGALREAITGGLTEGVLQEIPQSAAEQYFQNVAQGGYDPSVTPGQGVLNAAIQGGIAGFGMGANLVGFPRM
jgi:hypothetical protein